MEKKVYEFISKETGDPIVERRTCRRTGEEFPIYQKEKDLLEKISPIIGGKKYLLSLPTLCPEVRQIKRIAWRNERKFYKFTNEKGKHEITTISPDMGIHLMSQEDFYQNNNTQYGIPYTGSFFADWKILLKNMPYPSKLSANMENAEYCNQETDDKNCYLNAGGHFNENSMYNTYSLKGLWTVDTYWALESQYIYESINIHKSQKIFFSQEIESSFNILCSYDLTSCQNVIFGFGLRNASYMYKNKVLPKEEREVISVSYHEKLNSYLGLLSILEEYKAFLAQFPKKGINRTMCENVIGNELITNKDALLCTVGEEGKSLAYANIYAFASDCMDIESFARGEKNYNVANTIQLSNGIVGSHIFENVQNGNYVYFDRNCSFITGCMGLDHKKYCVLNKEYPKEEREQLTQTIAEELQSQGRYGDFFDIEDSPFPYNDSVAYDYYPIQTLCSQGQEIIINPEGRGSVTVLQPEKHISNALLDLRGEEKIKIKRRTKENEINVQGNSQQIKAQDLPDAIQDISDDIVDKTILCAETGRPFRIVAMELEFYRKHGLPLPRKHPDVRHAQRMTKRPKRKLYLKYCEKCRTEILSSYDEKVYCEECYNKEIYG